MPPATFGRRSVVPAIPRHPLATPSTTVTADGPVVPFMEGDSLLAALPMVTVGLALLLLAVFTAEVKLGFGAGTTIDGDTLMAFGGTSWAAVVGRGELWRLPLAPLLHASQDHLLGNTFSLFSIGLLLEPLVGHGWFAAIFCLGAMGATATSLIGNPAIIVAVGASGGIMAMVAAAFLLSWHPRASEDAAKMFRRSLLFGVPALLPLVLPLHPSQPGAPQVDYAAHLGGAVVGTLMAVGMQSLWPEERRRPLQGAWAGGFALACLVAVAVAACFAATGRTGAASLAATHQAQRAALAARSIPPEKLPARFEDGIPMAETFVRLYPQDPRSHLLQAWAWHRKQDFLDTERELERARDLIDKDEAHQFDAMRSAVTVSLALAQLQLGRPLDARATARLPCQAGDEVKKSLVTAGLCR